MQLLVFLCRFPASSDPEVFAAQRTLVEAWHVLDDTYVDDQFGGHDWQQVCALPCERYH